jgi:DNA-binding SARP family transcriptional activator
VRVLGPVQFVAADGEVVDLPSATQRRLLAILALAAGTTLRPEHLADVLDTSPGALRTAVSRLRARVGDETVRTDAMGYGVTCPVDAGVVTGLIAGAAGSADRLGVLDDALARWHGDALDEFRHEPWAEAEASRLDELRAIAVEDRADELIARAQFTDAVVALEAHVRREPRRDRPRGLLIQALAGAGRQADALEAYQDYRTFLVEETGTEPSAAVQAIDRRVAAGAAAPAAGEVIEVPLDPLLAAASPLIGRRRELSWLESALA